MVSEFAGSIPNVVYVYQGTAEQGPMFFESLDPNATAIADPDGDLFHVFSIERGGWREMFGLRSWRAGIRATLKGHTINRKIGDAWTLPSVLAIRGDRIIGEFRGRHAGDLPDVAALRSAVNEPA